MPESLYLPSALQLRFRDHAGKTAKVVNVKEDIVFVHLEHLTGHDLPLPKIAVEPAWGVLLAYDIDQDGLETGVVRLTRACATEKIDVKVGA